MARLDPIVDVRAPFVRRVRKRVALAAGFLLGGASAAALVIAARAGEPGATIVLTPPPPSAPPAPPPIVVTIQAPAPTPTPVVDAIARACPTITREDQPIGVPVELAAHDDGDETTLPQVVAAADAPQLAVRVGGRAWISDDDGRSFRPIFADRDVSSIALERGGVLYGASGNALGVRAPRERVTWRTRTDLACESCAGRLAMLGGEVAWATGADITVSADRGRTWKPVDTSEYAWGDGGRLVSWHGALYEIARYTDMCGVDDTYVHRLDAKHRVAHAIFPNNYAVDGPVLVADNATSTTWSWRVRCWRDPSTNRIGACSDTAAMRAELLTAGTIVPVEGGRALAVWSGALVELCGDGARQVAPHFAMDRVDAVDAVGRPLVMRRGVLYRWSPVHGWRRLFVVPDEQP